MKFTMRTFIRKQSALVLGLDTVVRFCNLADTQPLLLIQEPENPADGSAVRLTDLMGQNVGYVAREDALIVSKMIDDGAILLCRTDGPCQCVKRDIFIWEDGEQEEEIELERKLYRKGREIVTRVKVPS